VHIAGSIHDEDPIRLPARCGATAWPSRAAAARHATGWSTSGRPTTTGSPRLARWIDEERDPTGRTDRHLFLSLTTGGPLTVSGLDQHYQRIQAELGNRCFPYMARHTWTTRLVEEAARVIEAASV
jgi:integrase